MIQSGVRWIRQDPVYEDTCGQCCLAMLLGVGKRRVIAAIGHDEGTTTREMIVALRRGGFVVAERLRKFRTFEAIPTPRALLLGYWKEYPHWMAWSQGRLFDPVEGIVDLRRTRLPRRLRVTHYLSLRARR